jgi:lysophospholipase L1-like esterase
MMLVAFQVVATVVLLELALRLIRPHHPGLNNVLYLPSVTTEFSRAGTTSEAMKMLPQGFQPGATSEGFVLNSRGLRTHEYVEERGAGLRIVTLGDSFTWGVVPFRDTWPVRLQSMVRKALDRRDVEVISLGVPGAGPKFYLRMWELEGRRLRPDVVILGFFIGNDLTDHSRLRPEAARNSWLVEHSLAARAIRNLARVATSGIQAEDGEHGEENGRIAASGRLGYELPGHADGFDPARHAIKEKAFMKIEWSRMALCLEGNRPMVRRLVRKGAPVLRELDRSVRDSGAELVVFLIPDEFQVDDELSGRLLEMHDIDPAEYVGDLPQRMLIRFFRKTGIRHVDGLQRFRSRSGRADLYLPSNTHWNATGNRLAAKMMADSLQTSIPVLESRARFQ